MCTRDKRILNSSRIFYKEMIVPLKQKAIKNNKGLRICNEQALMKIGHKIFLIANPIRMFLVEIPGSPKTFRTSFSLS